MIAKRLRPGQDLRHQLERLANEHEIQSGVLLSAVGSLSVARLRNAGGTRVLDIAGPLEIVSATGTLSVNGMHVHLSVSDPEGGTTGGHLLDGCLIGSTAEIVVGTISGVEFHREQDEQTGCAELVIKPASEESDT